MNVCGISLTPVETAAVIGIGTTLLSEAIAASPLKENSIVQIGLSIVRGYTRRIGANAPVISDRKAAPVQIQQPRPDKASPAPRRRGRPRKTNPSS